MIITGLSGSGKSTAIRALEDLGFFCVDNLPIPLVSQFLYLCTESQVIQGAALVIDVRERAFLEKASEALEALAEAGHNIEICFLDASNQVLIRRYQETRRKHPVPGETLAQSVAAERELLAPLKERSDSVIDSSFLNIYQLKRILSDRYGSPDSTIHVSLSSFGFKHGVPSADFVFDVRFLANPYFVPHLKDKSGQDPEVRDFVLQQPAAQKLLSHLVQFLSFAFHEITAEGRGRVTAAIGCTGGKHRSVAIVEALEGPLSAALSLPISVFHRDYTK